MKIGLIRHFRVLHPYPQKTFVDTQELLQWFEDYDKAEIETSEVDLEGINWKHCYSSDLYRCLQTAKHFYPGIVMKRKELREIPMTPFKMSLSLPFLLWAMLVRLSWSTNQKKKKEIIKIRQGINKLLDDILDKKEDTLIVSHGALMIFIEKELKMRGFHGPKLRNPLNGKLYIYQNED
ncbi:histidine phosphatase family protein [Neobacillus sp. D3-1R]|uniref:histidine phosphatase family protein n=1 Tax=Neobacillus sp. D3-1R TaxID=3445778 RepID=UPI003F9EDAF7